MGAAARATEAPARDGNGTRPDRGGAGRPAPTPAPLMVGRADDAAEREADTLADRLLKGLDPVRVGRHAPAVRRACAACAEEDRTVRRAADGAGDRHGGTPAPAPVASLLAQPGRALDPAVRGWFEQRMGQGLGQVRIHDGPAAGHAAAAIGARAFTSGHHIAFGTGQYAPETPAGQRLLAHELVHVAQGGLDVRRACTHDGTPVNCHNMTLPMPPWIAGSIAHQQVAVWAGIPTQTIPRASKRFMGQPGHWSMAAGFADLWQNGATDVRFGEIKSTLTGSGIAAAEAGHYAFRHNEWLGRLPSAPLMPDDAIYLARVGGPKPGLPLDLSTRTGTGIPIGPFAGDPGKTLNVEADALGALVYWCTGIGLTNPLWLILFQKAIDALRKKFQALKRQIEQILGEIGGGIVAAARWILARLSEAADWVSQNLGTILLVLLAILLVVLIILFWAEILIALAAAAAAVAAAASEIAAAVMLAAAAAAILLMLGVPLPNFEGATRTTASALRPDAAESTVSASSYDPPGDTSPSAQARTIAAHSADPGAELIASLEPLTNSDTLVNAALSAARGGINERQLRAAMRQGIGALSNAGDAAGAGDIARRLQDANLG